MGENVVIHCDISRFFNQLTRIMRPCVFLDRDGVLNEDRVNYAYRLDHFHILKGVPEALQLLKDHGYLLIVVTNQSGIAQGIYTEAEMHQCHQFLQQECNHLIDHFYYSPYHPSVTASLLRKPGTLMFEKAIARYGVDVNASWMVGDKGRDLIPARAMGLRTIQVGHEVEPENRGEFIVDNLTAAARVILGKA